MKTNKNGEFRSSVYTQRPPYADFDAPAKFQAIQSIIAKRLKEHPNAMCSYSGGSDSDIMMHMIETVRKIFNLPPVKYFFFETGLEMDATRRHVKEMAENYGVSIQTIRPKKNIVQATRECGQPFVSKIMSAGLEAVQKKNIPLSIADEYDQAEDKAAKRKELKSRYGWHISNLKIYDHPRELREFNGLQETRFGWEPVPITRPPQSWRYVEEELWND